MLTVTLTLHSNPTFSLVTLTHNDLPASQVWLQKGQQFTRHSRNSHILMTSAPHLVTKGWTVQKRSWWKKPRWTNIYSPPTPRITAYNKDIYVWRKQILTGSKDLNSRMFLTTSASLWRCTSLLGFTICTSKKPKPISWITTRY